MEPWYRDGLRFTCTQCGKCCTGAPGVVWLNEAEITAMAEYRREPVEEFRATWTRIVGQDVSLREKTNGDCIFYDAQLGCTVYPVRPSQCRTWPFWESNLESEEEWQRTQQDCPGAGKGELFDVEEITKRLRTIRI